LPENVPAALEARFPALAGHTRAPRPRRVFVDAPADIFREVVDHACDALGYDRLVTITGMDEKDAFAALYSLGHADGSLLNVRLRVPRDAPRVPTLTARFPGAVNYERELEDLLGFVVEGLAPGRRYPLPDDWPLDQKPLRKDWKPAGAATPAAPVAGAPVAPQVGSPAAAKSGAWQKEPQCPG
jgi:Ni,Fe-hydrogenase III component G